MSPFASATCAFGMLVGFALVSTARQTRHPRHRRTDDEFSTSFLSEHERLAVIRRAAPDIAKYLPLSFDPSFDSPCFKDAKGAMQCLPAFFIAGGMQCGSDVLWQRLMSHGHIGRQHDGRSHWWTLHPRSRAGTFERYLSLFSNERTLATLQREPRTLLGEVSPATFAFMMAEMLRLHYLYLDAFSACHGRCRSRNPPPEHAALCARKTYDLAHCYVAANNATVPEEFNVPSLISTVLAARPPRVVALLREPSLRLWVAFGSTGSIRLAMADRTPALPTTLAINPPLLSGVSRRTVVGGGDVRCALRRTAQRKPECTITLTSWSRACMRPSSQNGKRASPATICW